MTQHCRKGHLLTLLLTPTRVASTMAHKTCRHSTLSRNATCSCFCNMSTAASLAMMHELGRNSRTADGSVALAIRGAAVPAQVCPQHQTVCCCMTGGRDTTMKCDMDIIRLYSLWGPALRGSEAIWEQVQKQVCIMPPASQNAAMCPAPDISNRVRAFCIGSSGCIKSEHTLPNERQERRKLHSENKEMTTSTCKMEAVSEHSTMKVDSPAMMRSWAPSLVKILSATVIWQALAGT